MQIQVITRTILELFCSQVLEPTRCGHCFGIPINTIWSSAGFVNPSSWKTGIYLKELSKMRGRKIYLWNVLDLLNPGHRMGEGVGFTKSWCNQWSPPFGCHCSLTELVPGTISTLVALASDWARQSPPVCGDQASTTARGQKGNTLIGEANAQRIAKTRGPGQVRLTLATS